MLLVTGHYEGFDERVREGLADDELSIGDDVLTNGALPAMVVIDTVTRLLLERWATTKVRTTNRSAIPHLRDWNIRNTRGRRNFAG